MSDDPCGSSSSSYRILVRLVRGARDSRRRVPTLSRRAGAGEAVVEPHPVQVTVGADEHADVAQAIDLGPDLADLARDELLVEDQAILREGAGGWKGRNDELVVAQAPHRHAGLVDATEAGDLPPPGQLHRLEDFFRRHQVPGAGLVPRAPPPRAP